MNDYKQPFDNSPKYPLMMRIFTLIFRQPGRNIFHLCSPRLTLNLVQGLIDKVRFMGKINKNQKFYKKWQEII